MPILPRSFRTCLAAALVALAAPAVRSAPPAADAPAPAKPPEDPVAAMIERCRSADPAKERDCYAAELDARLAEGGPAPVLRLLDRLAALDPDVRRDGHFHAHRIGISALKSPAEVGRVFATCTPGWQSGCYNGVIQSYFIATQRGGGGVTGESVETLCGDYRGRRADLLFQCTHGLGHGLAILYGHDLPRALDSCDLLGREGEREMCYAGAFMESLVNATHPHSVSTAGGAGAGAGTGAKATAVAANGGHKEHGGHGGHGPASGGAGPARAPFKALDPADLHYPCSRMDEKYLVACYTIQTSAMLHHSGRDVGRTARECGRAPEKARAACFLSLGRDVSTIAQGEHAEAVRLCGLAEAAFRPVCHRGVVESIVNMNADPAEGIPYCRAVDEPAGKRACYSAVGLQALVLPEGEGKRDRACRLAEAELVEICLGGPAAPPPGRGS